MILYIRKMKKDFFSRIKTLPSNVRNCGALRPISAIAKLEGIIPFSLDIRKRIAIGG